MTLADILAVLSGGAVGAVLALIGGGGSILATPALLYVVGVTNPHIAIGTSALAVSVNAFANLINHARRGHVRWRYSMIFAAAGVLGATAGAAIGKVTDPDVLLPLFAIIMIVAGIFMLRRKTDTPAEEARFVRARVPRLLLYGQGAGLLSGFFGIGGGFLIVPALVFATDMPLVYAVSSSLVAVLAFGLTTATSYAFSGLVDWPLTAVFIAGGLVGGFAGVKSAHLLADKRTLLNDAFVGVISCVAIYMLIRSWM